MGMKKVSRNIAKCIQMYTVVINQRDGSEQVKAEEACTRLTRSIETRSLKLRAISYYMYDNKKINSRNT